MGAAAGAVAVGIHEEDDEEEEEEEKTEQKTCVHMSNRTALRNLSLRLNGSDRLGSGLFCTV